MSCLLQSECLMLRWLFPSQAVAYGLIYGYVMILPCIFSLICELPVSLLLACDSEPSILPVRLYWFCALQAIPCAARFQTDRIGGRTRGPSPLIHQWFDFCLQSARSLPFRQDVIPGASPLFIDNPVPEVPQELNKRKPKLDTNLVRGVPPPEILERCEFLEPLSDKALVDYQWLMLRMQRPRRGLFGNALQKISTVLDFKSIFQSEHLYMARFCCDSVRQHLRVFGMSGIL